MRAGGSAAVGLQHVAVDVDLALAHRRQVDHGAQRAADQALDLLGAARLLPASGFAVGASMGRARQHAVFGGHPAALGVAHPRRHLFVDRGGAQHMGVAELDQARALGMTGKARFEGYFAKLVGGAAGRAHCHSPEDWTGLWPNPERGTSGPSSSPTQAMRIIQPRLRKPSRIRAIIIEPWVSMASGTRTRMIRNCCRLDRIEVPSPMAITPTAKVILIARACRTLPVPIHQ